jgi:hypothetical protein
VITAAFAHRALTPNNRWSNDYDWRAFLAALLCSSGVALLWSVGAWLLRRCAHTEGPGVAVLLRIPGMKAFTGARDWDPASMRQLPVSAVSGAHGVGAAGSEAKQQQAAAAAGQSDAQAVV